MPISATKLAPSCSDARMMAPIIFVGILAYSCSTVMAAFQHSSRVALNNDDFISPEFRYFRSLPGRMFKPRDFVSKERRMKTLSQLLGRDGVAEGGRPGKGKRDTDAANDLWLRSRRSGKEEEEAAEAEPTFWLRARREGGHGFWLRARRGSEQEPGFWLRARKEDEPGFWLRARRSREPQARAERGDPGFWLRSRRSESSHIWLRSKKGKGQPENVL